MSPLSFYNVQLINGVGDVVTAFNVDESEMDYLVLTNLYNLALRKARRVDEAMEELINELDSNEEIGSDAPFPGDPPF
jgi:hypothetical protein